MELPWSTRMTLAAYDELPADGYRYEVLEGELMMSPSPGFRHQLTLGHLFVLLRAWHAATKDRGFVLMAPLDVILSEDTIVQPDLLYLAHAHRSHIRGERIHGPPDLAVEIFRTRSAKQDRVAKLQVYAKFGVSEYWLVDLDQRTVTMLELAGSTYVPLAEGSGETLLASRILAGFELRPDTIFSEE